MRKASVYGLALGVLLIGFVLMMSCGEFLSLEPDCRISMIDPSPVSPVKEISGVVFRLEEKRW